MAFNIKSDETHKRARDIADRTGVSMSDAVESALRDKQAALDSESRYARAMRVVELARKHRDKEFSSEDHADYLYDEDGLPK